MQAVGQPCAEQDPGAVALVGCGHINNGQTVVIVDSETCKPLRDGCVGEIWISGASVCQGYWNNPESTENIFQARLVSVSDDALKDLVFVRSGDLGFIHDGELYVSGRSKDIIIINGKNYYPQDIELAVANAHPDLVKDGGATFSVVDKDGLEQVIVTHEITRVRARDHDFDAIRKRVTAVISELFEIELAGFVLLKPGRVAKTSSGKIKRGASKAAYINDELECLDIWVRPSYRTTNEQNDEVEHTEPDSVDTDDIESVQLWLQHLVAAYQSLDIDDLDVFRPLAEYGLTSVTIMKILGDISQEIDQEVEPTLIWEYPTINELSNKIVSIVSA
jgi:acyl carrier protein